MSLFKRKRRSESSWFLVDAVERSLMYDSFVIPSEQERFNLSEGFDC
jgi:hypothetical protein